MSSKKSILILCTGNSARSQIAEALLKHICGNKYKIFSAGTEPSEVRPEAIEAIEELELSMNGYTSKSVDEFADQEMDFVLTVCDNAKENCPVYSARTKLIHKAFEDPAAVEGDEETILEAFKKTRNEINQYFAGEFLFEIGETEEAKETEE